MYEGYVGHRAVSACATFKASALDNVSLKNSSAAPVEATYVGSGHDGTFITSRYSILCGVGAGLKWKRNL